MIHLLASGIFGTVNAVVPFRTFVSTRTLRASNFGIYTIGVVILPASGTRGGAFQPDGRLDEASCKKRAGGCKECPHFTAVNLRLELARKDSLDTWMTSLSKSVKGLL